MRKFSLLKLFLNAVGFQIVWFTCAFTVQSSPPFNMVWIGLATLVFLSQHFYFNSNKSEFVLTLKVATLGWIIDTLLIQNHSILFEGSYFDSPLNVQPFCMTCLWLSLGASLNHSLAWLKNFINWSPLIGSALGTLSYLAGEHFGVLHFESCEALFITAASWAVALPILILFSMDCS